MNAVFFLLFLLGVAAVANSDGKPRTTTDSAANVTASAAESKATADPSVISHVELTFKPEFQKLNKTVVEGYANDLKAAGAANVQVTKDLKIDAKVNQALKEQIVLDDLTDVADV